MQGKPDDSLKHHQDKKMQKAHNSYVLNWAEKFTKKMKYVKDIHSNDIVSYMILSGSSFKKFGSNLEPFSGDASLFEIVCYYLFELDFWIYKNQPEYREISLPIIARKIIELFSTSLKIPKNDVRMLIKNRLTNYAEIAKDTNDVEDYVIILSECIRRTKNNTIPKNYESYDYSQTRRNGMRLFFKDTYQIKLSLLILMSNMLPPFYQLLESINFYDIQADY